MRRNAGSRDHVVLTQRTSWQLGFLAGCQTSHLERLTQRNDYLMLKSMFCMFQLPIGISDPTVWMAELPKAARTPGPLRNWTYFGWLHSSLMASYGSWVMNLHSSSFSVYFSQLLWYKKLPSIPDPRGDRSSFYRPWHIFCNVKNGWNRLYTWGIPSGNQTWLARKSTV